LTTSKLHYWQKSATAQGMLTVMVTAKIQTATINRHQQSALATAQ